MRDNQKGKISLWKSYNKEQHLTTFKRIMNKAIFEPIGNTNSAAIQHARRELYDTAFVRGDLSRMLKQRKGVSKALQVGERHLGKVLT